MTHNERLTWLAEHGFGADHTARRVSIPSLGECLWIDGHKGKRQVSLWLSVRDGTAIIHGVNDKDLAFQELQAWIVPPVFKPLPSQKSLFSFEE